MMSQKLPDNLLYGNNSRIYDREPQADWFSLMLTVEQLGIIFKAAALIDHIDTASVREALKVYYQFDFSQNAEAKVVGWGYLPESLRAQGDIFKEHKISLPFNIWQGICRLLKQSHRGDQAGAVGGTVNIGPVIKKIESLYESS